MEGLLTLDTLDAGVGLPRRGEPVGVLTGVGGSGSLAAGVGIHGCNSPVANPLQMFTRVVVSLKTNNVHVNSCKNNLQISLIENLKISKFYDYLLNLVI